MSAMTTTSRSRLRTRLARPLAAGRTPAQSDYKARRIERSGAPISKGTADPLLPGSGYFDSISDSDAQELLGPTWTRSEARLQVAWELALHGHSAGWLVTHCGVTPAFAQALVSRARIAKPQFFALSTLAG